MSKHKGKAHTYHHYVPQCYLRQFGYPKKNTKPEDKDYFVNAFDKNLGKVYPKGVEDVCGEDFFYKLDLSSTQEAGVNEMYLELDYFAKHIETELSRILSFMNRHLLSAVNDNYQGLVIPEMARLLVGKHLAIQFLRHPNIREYDSMLIADTNDLITGFITRNNLQDNKEAKKLVSDDSLSKDKAMTHAMLSFMNEDLIFSIASAISQNIWVYYYSRNSDFFTSDNPINITQHYKGIAQNTLMGLNRYGAEISYTLNPNFILSIFDREYFQDKIMGDDLIVTCSEQELQHYNILQYRSAKQYVFSKSKNFEHASNCFQIDKILNIE